MSASDKFVEIAGKIGSQRHLVSIRDSFAILMPMMLAGSLATLINNVPLSMTDTTKSLGNTLTNLGLGFIVEANGAVWWTLGMITLLLVIILAHTLSKNSGEDGISAAIVAFSTYISVASVSNPDGPWAYAGSVYMLIAVLVAIGATELFIFLGRQDALVIKMPEGVPPAVARGFAAILPGIITIYAFTLVAIFFSKIYGNNIFIFVTEVISAPLRGLSNTLPAALILVFFVHLLWIFGLHGPNVLGGVLGPILTPAIIDNTAQFAAGTPATEVTYIITQPFLDNFVYIGGSGTTLGLVIALFMFSKSKAHRITAAVGIGPGCFNINEPVIFGLPIVMNPIFAIPFIVTPMVLTVTTYLAMFTGIVNRTIVPAHWTFPIIVSGLIVTGGDIKAPILQIINLAIAVAIFMPFVIFADKAERRNEAAA